MSEQRYDGRRKRNQNTIASRDISESQCNINSRIKARIGGKSILNRIHYKAFEKNPLLLITTMFVFFACVCLLQDDRN